MSYYTRYTLESVTGEVNPNIDYAEDIGRHSEYNDGENFIFAQECKWYNMKNDMINYSKSHPNILFAISGEGEENGDLWKAYFINGKFQICKSIIAFEPFDVSKLC